MAEKVIGTSVVVVISPLTSLMKDQVKITTEWHGISAAAIYSGQDDEVLQNIEDGVYSIVYTSPEAFLATKRWRYSSLPVHLAFKRIVLQSLSMKHIVWFTGGSTYNRICFIIWRNFCVIQ